MTVMDILKSMSFVVDQQGRPTAAVLDMDAWETFLSLLEDIEDAELVRDRTRNWRTKAGWTRWDGFQAELDGDAVPSLD